MCWRKRRLWLDPRISPAQIDSHDRAHIQKAKASLFRVLERGGTASGIGIDCIALVIQRCQGMLVSFPDAREGKNTSGNPPIPFWFRCAGMLAHCSM